MRFYLSIVLLFIVINLQAQFDGLVRWSAEYDAAQSAIILTADLKDDWVIYSQHTDPEGPIPLEFEFETVSGVTFEGPVEELTKPITKMSEMFGVEVMKFKDKATFSQKIKLDTDPVTIKGMVAYMTCDSQRCLPPKSVPFQVKI